MGPGVLIHRYALALRPTGMHLDPSSVGPAMVPGSSEEFTVTEANLESRTGKVLSQRGAWVHGSWSKAWDHEC